MNVTPDQIIDALAAYSSTSRLYAITVDSPDSADLMVEAFSGDDRVNDITSRDVIAISTNAFIDLDRLLGQPAQLHVSLADGSRATFAGDVIKASMLGSHGGLTRYGLQIASWMWRLTQARNSRVWQDKTVIEIVETVFNAYRPLAKWRWSDEAAPFVDQVGPCSYCCQYRETDYQFVQRLLAEEGLSWRAEDTDDGPAIVLFADSTQHCAISEDASSAADGGIRFHGIGPAERQDTVQAVRSLRGISASMTSVLSYDYKTKKNVHASSPSRLPASARLPSLEAFDVPGQYAFANRVQAQRYADLQMEGKEARSQLWEGRSTVRTLRAGNRLVIRNFPLKRLATGTLPPCGCGAWASTTCRPKRSKAWPNCLAPYPNNLQRICAARIYPTMTWSSRKPTRPATPTRLKQCRPTSPGALCCLVACDQCQRAY